MLSHTCCVCLSVILLWLPVTPTGNQHDYRYPYVSVVDILLRFYSIMRTIVVRPYHEGRISTIIPRV